MESPGRFGIDGGDEEQEERQARPVQRVTEQGRESDDDAEEDQERSLRA
jgi:hypothetical protein